MKTKTIYMTLALFVAMLVVLSATSTTFAQEFGLELEEGLHPHEEGVMETPKLEFPEIEPTLTLGGGYKLFSSKDSRNTPRNEYYDQEDTPIYLLSTEVFRYPDRFTMDLVFDSKPKDHFADIGYGYRDIILARGINRAMYHNLDNIRILPSTNQITGTPNNNVLQYDSPSKEYGLRTMISTAQLRLKAPNYPMHLFVDYDQVQKNGDRQQRYRDLVSSVQHSIGRDVEFMTNDYGFGLNSHLGPVEAEYTFHSKKFKDHGDDILYDTQAASGIYPAGTWPHNVNSGLREYRHALKFHTMYTGKLVASVTLSKTGQENNYGDAERDILFGGGSVTFMPVTPLVFTAKYRHREVDNDTPSQVVINSLDGASSTPVTPKEAIDSKTDTFDLSARYRFLNWLTLRGFYTFERQDRDGNMADWGNMRDATRKQVLGAQADTQFGRMLQAKVRYDNTKYIHPAYNIQPDRGHDIKTSVTFTPIEFLTAFASYKYTLEERDHIHYWPDSAYMDDLHPDERKVEKHTVNSNVTVMLMSRVTLSGFYAYFQNHTEQDLIHALSNPPAPLVTGDHTTDPDSMWQAESHVYGAQINVDQSKRLHMEAGVTFVETEAKLDWAWREVIPMPRDMETITNVETKETIAHAGARIKLPDNFEMDLRYQYSIFDDKADNGYTTFEDGQSHLVLLTFTKTLGKGT